MNLHVEAEMKLYTVTFDDSNVVELEDGIAVEGADGRWTAHLGTDVGGATLANVPLRIPLIDVRMDASTTARSDAGETRLLSAGLEIGEEGALAFVANDDRDARALVVLSVIQRSPDARTEVAELGDGVVCVGNAYERPMDKQLLLLEPDANVRFRRFERGGNFGPWFRVSWDGLDLSLGETAEGPS